MAEPLGQGAVGQVFLHIPHGARIQPGNKQTPPPGNQAVAQKTIHIAPALFLLRDASASLFKSQADHDVLPSAAPEKVVDGLELIPIARVVGAGNHRNKCWTKLGLYDELGGKMDNLETGWAKARSSTPLQRDRIQAALLAPADELPDRQYSSPPGNGAEP